MILRTAATCVKVNPAHLVCLHIFVKILCCLFKLIIYAKLCVFVYLCNTVNLTNYN